MNKIESPRRKTARPTKPNSDLRGKLKIGDDWNAITIIALSQSNPLKAVAEFVENSIDAGATQIDIIRGKEKGESYLRIRDNGKGIPRDKQGIPNFKYVATHICDSIKRQLKSKGEGGGLQGEFGIGLLSFWTVGETLIMRSPSAEGKTYEMRMTKGDPSYVVSQRRTLFEESGTDMVITPLLPGLRQFSGEKIQSYLASELRDRIRLSKVDINVIDRTSRKRFKVEPRKFDGRLLHDLPLIKDVYLELYLNDNTSENQVGLYRSGTRVIPNITDIERFAHAPWTSHYLQGIVDAAALNLTPGTRLGIVHDEFLDDLCEAIKPLEKALNQIIEAQQAAEEEQASAQIMRTISKAFKEAMMSLPAEDYDWFDLHRHTSVSGRQAGGAGYGKEDMNEHGEAQAPLEMVEGAEIESDHEPDANPQRSFFEYAGPLASVRISPSSSVVRVNESRTLKAVVRDKKRQVIDREVLFQWRILEGEGELTSLESEVITYNAPTEPGLVKIGITATEGDVMFEDEALITVTESLIENSRSTGESSQQGLPAYSYQRAAGELWRSKFDIDNNVVIVNSGHRDFVHASRARSSKLRYICRLYAKELVIKNFPGTSADELLERMIEISMYTEDNLR